MIAGGARRASCGDNSAECGPGTNDKDGVCTARPRPAARAPSPTSSTGQCVPDGSMVCTDGTGVRPDERHLQDRPERVPGRHGADRRPVRRSDRHGSSSTSRRRPSRTAWACSARRATTPAGAIALKPVGQHFVLHGHITPFEDNDGDGLNDADVDAYTVTVSGPSLLHVTADGVHGLAAGFVALDVVAAGSPLASWTRYGINLTGDTSDRQLFLPARRHVPRRDLRHPLAVPAGRRGRRRRRRVLRDDRRARDAGADAADHRDRERHESAATSCSTRRPMGTGINDIVLDMPQAQANASVVVAEEQQLQELRRRGSRLLRQPDARRGDRRRRARERQRARRRRRHVQLRDRPGGLHADRHDQRRVGAVDDRRHRDADRADEQPARRAGGRAAARPVLLRRHQPRSDDRPRAHVEPPGARIAARRQPQLHRELHDLRQLRPDVDDVRGPAAHPAAGPLLLPRLRPRRHRGDDAAVGDEHDLRARPDADHRGHADRQRHGRSGAQGRAVHVRRRHDRPVAAVRRDRRQHGWPARRLVRPGDDLRPPRHADREHRPRRRRGHAGVLALVPGRRRRDRTHPARRPDDELLRQGQRGGPGGHDDGQPRASPGARSSTSARSPPPATPRRPTTRSAARRRPATCCSAASRAIRRRSRSTRRSPRSTRGSSSSTPTSRSTAR